LLFVSILLNQLDLYELLKMNIFNKKNILALDIIVILALFSVVSCGDKDNNSSENTNKGNNDTDSLVIEIAGFTGKSVFDLTLEKYHVNFVESSMGIFIKAIDSIASTRNFGWIFSVNDSFVPVASNDYITNDTDVIKWHYKKF